MYDFEIVHLLGNITRTEFYCYSTTFPLAAYLRITFRLQLADKTEFAVFN